MMCDQIPSKIRALDRDHVDTIFRPSHQSPKSIVTVFFGVNRLGLVKIQLEDTKRISEYFNDQVLQTIYQGSHASWQLIRLTHFTLHSDNASVHDAKGVPER
jgi:hypothetical protein